MRYSQIDPSGSTATPSIQNFALTLPRGLTCLFSGPRGIGKSIAALSLSNALDLIFYRIELSLTVSKYIGKTEMSLAQIFDEAEVGRGVLVPDEADTGFGKRTEAKDARDR